MLLLKNAKVLTLNDADPVCDSILIDGDIIVGVGSIENFADNPAVDQIVDLNGSTVIPGFTDSHIHLLHYAQFLSVIDCDTDSRQNCLYRVAEQVQNTPEGTWIKGHGWNNHHWEENEIHKKLLDAIAPDHPVYLSNKSLHGAWVNSKALEICGIDESTPDPEGGRIGRDAEGTPNGLLFESGVTLVLNSFPELTADEAATLIEQAQTKLFQYGITTVHDFDRTTCFKALQCLDRDNKLKIRVVKSLPVESVDDISSIGLQAGFGTPHLTFRFIKLFMDGALGTQTAAMLEPYENTDEVGMLLMKKEDLLTLAKKASKNHLQLAIHAIGDLANQVVIEVFQELREWEKDNQIIGLSHRIEHLQTCRLEDIEKLQGLNVIASVQPIHLASDVPAAEKLLGKRNIGTYAFNSLHCFGIPTVFGSDAPVELPDCLLGLHTAVHRTQRDDTPVGGWQPQQKILPAEALKSFTSSPHEYFPLRNTKLGKIQPGYLADLVVLNDYPLHDTTYDFKSIEIQKTMVAGKWVWES